jgi:hypothetical protein
MKNNLVFDFAVEKNTLSVIVNREFDANLSLVWHAFTSFNIIESP